MSLQISKAKDGGYYVQGGTSQPNMYRDIVFAGTLAECLKYIRDAMKPSP